MGKGRVKRSAFFLTMGNSFVDFHTYMDYVSETQDLETAYEQVKADFCRE